MNDGSDALDQALDLAVQHHNAGELPQAQRLYQQVLEAEPDHPVALHLLGVVASQVGQFDDAVNLMTAAIAVDPEYDEVYINLAGVHRQLGQLEAAAEHYQNFININPDIAEILLHLGNVLQDIGKLDAAAACCQKAISLNPDMAEAYNYFGAVLLKLGRTEEAATNYKKAISLNPNVYLLHFNLHTTCYGSDDMEPALLCLEDAAKLAPDDQAINFFQGLAHDMQGHKADAAAHFDAIQNDDDANIARLDSWQYIKSVTPSPAPLFWDVEEGHRQGMAAAKNDGFILELGVASGRSIRYLATLAGQDLHGFDSFEGIPDAWNNFSSGAFSTHGKLPEVPENVHLHVGLFESSLQPFLEEHAGPLRLLHVDCDLYGSTKTIFELLGDRIVSGTVIIFDEYHGYPNWRDHEFKAFKEAVAHNGWEYDYLGFSFSSQQAIVKLR